MIDNEDNMTKFISAIESSSVMLNQASKAPHILEILQNVSDSITHFFERIAVYQLLPNWSFHISRRDDVEETWESDEITHFLSRTVPSNTKTINFKLN
jgi:hypothetical protein